MHRPFTRNASDRLLAGVASGLADRLGVDRVVVRLSFVVLAFAGGAGVLLYLVLWVLGSRAGAPAEGSPIPGGRPLERNLAVILVVGGSLLMLRQLGAWFGDPLVGSVALGAVGSAIIWATPGSGRSPFAGVGAKLRLVAGGLLILGGMAAFLAAKDAFAVSAIRNLAFAVTVTAAGTALIFGPGMWALVRQLTEERRERIRSDERARMAAHLHDSVLQSLALIQRARTPKEMSSLARRQERELRTWLYERPGRHAEGSLAAAFEEAADRVEGMQHVRVEVVTVGDRRLDEPLRELVGASGEAMMNAAKHSGVDVVAVYVEVEPGGVSAFVRDEGTGFDPALVDGGRRGIAESIRGRMERAGGTAEILTAPGRGTEVRLHLPSSRNGSRPEQAEAER